MRLVLEYDGTQFHGSQSQPRVRTVQDELERALARLTGEKIRVALAGRTDTGVHATGQVASFSCSRDFSTEVLCRGLNALLPQDLAVRRVDPALPDFHARFAAGRRDYRYLIWNEAVRSPLWRRFAAHVRTPLDVALMSRAAAVLVGEHDFASFAGAGMGTRWGGHEAGSRGRGTVRTIVRAEVSLVAGTLPAPGRLIQIEVAADAFLPHMVRNIVGVLVAVGREKVSAEDVCRLLEARDRRLAPATAPAHGLTLVAVHYPQEGTHSHEIHAAGTNDPARSEGLI